VEEIVTEIESRERGLKRKTTTYIPTPIEKDNQKKLKKGEPLGVEDTKNMENRLEKLESLANSQNETNKDMKDMMKQVLELTKATGKESKSDSSLTHEKLESLEKRVITLESEKTTKGDWSSKEINKGEITKAKRSIKILNMRDIVTEENLKQHLESSLNLTKATMANMGMVEMFRLGKQPTKASDPCPPILVFFSTVEMAERILNAARSLGQSRNFKENIPAAYSTAYNDFIRVGNYLKENQGLAYRLKYEGHTLQLQVRKPNTEQYKTMDIFEPAVDDNEETDSAIDLNGISKPPEEDRRKLTFILGDIKMDTEAKPIQVPGEIIDMMDSDEATAMKAACTINVERKPGNKITITCKTREDALLLAKWKGNQQRGAYSLNPLPDCIYNLKWD